MAGPLLDMAKLDDVSGDFVATLSGEEILERVLPWADAYDKDLAAVLRADRELALRALRIERVDTDNPRKDLRKWSEFRRVYGFFFASIFELVTDPADERFGGLPPELVRELAARFAAGYVAPGPDVAWFEQIRTLAGSRGFALKAKDNKKNPDAYPGSISDAAAVIRVLLTGTRQSPDLAQVADALGRDEVLRRVNALG